MKVVRIHNTDFNVKALKGMKKEDFLKAFEALKGILNLEDAWKELKKYT